MTLVLLEIDFDCCWIAISLANCVGGGTGCTGDTEPPLGGLEAVTGAIYEKEMKSDENSSIVKQDVEEEIKWSQFLKSRSLKVMYAQGVVLGGYEAYNFSV